MPAELTSPPTRPSRSTIWSKAVGDFVLVGHIGGEEDRVLVGEGGLGSGQRVAVGIEHRHRPAIVKQSFGDRQADARCAAGDDRRMLHLMRSRIET